ncbi:MAG: hypothetical protein P1S60_19765, partial [Anaerolineae bacterium]|nr:hypothetical protein [Anaerolineae bacterium]
NDASGGGIAIIDHSRGNIINSTIGYNSSGRYGGGLFVKGSEVYVSQSIFTQNEVSPGVQENMEISYGAAVFSTPDQNKGYSVYGALNDNVFSRNKGLAIFDDDYSSGPVNDLRYNKNLFFETTFNDIVYRSGLSWFLSTYELNNLVITRMNGTQTYKSQVDNAVSQTVPRLVAYVVVPPTRLAAGSGSPVPDMPIKLSFVWDAAWVQVDNQPITTQPYVADMTSGDDIVINVEGDLYVIGMLEKNRPTVSLIVETADTQTYLSWQVQCEVLLYGTVNNDLAIDHSAKSGHVLLPEVDRIYYYYAITPEGGVLAERDAGKPELNTPDELFFLTEAGQPAFQVTIPVENLGGSVLIWSSWAIVDDVITILEPLDVVMGEGVVVVKIDPATVPVGVFHDSVGIDAGDGGTAVIDITVRVAYQIHKHQFPVILR